MTFGQTFIGHTAVIANDTTTHSNKKRKEGQRRHDEA
jgi:hypothetical protein